MVVSSLPNGKGIISPTYSAVSVDGVDVVVDVAVYIGVVDVPAGGGVGGGGGGGGGGEGGGGGGSGILKYCAAGGGGSGILKDCTTGGGGVVFRAIDCAGEGALLCDDAPASCPLEGVVSLPFDEANKKYSK